MNDALLSLAFAIHSNPGVYALLLGSGVSRSAGVPTGWEVVVDLIRKLAMAQGEDPEPNPPAWYLSKFGEAPDYDRLLEALGGTPSERSGLLRAYFEASEDERQQGLKVPSPAHHAIAQMVRDSYFRMVLTTNFDRLLEMALDSTGISYDVIGSDDALKGARPYIHSNCVIVKLHGDYRDTRIKNTERELAVYSDQLNKYLDRILDEFGLIVCGWSAEWDAALRSAILRCSSRRYTTYWTVRGDLTKEGQRLINHRDARIIPIQTADKFFSDLAQKVEALREISAPHPVSAQVATATTKKLLAEDRFRIQLHDFITEEVERAQAEFEGPLFEFEDLASKDDKTRKVIYERQMRNYETIAKTPVQIVATLCQFDDGKHSEIVKRALERTAVRPRRAGSLHLINLQLYPALLLLYAAGLASITSGHVAYLPKIFTDPKVSFDEGPQPIIRDVNTEAVFRSAAHLIPGPQGVAWTRANKYLFDVLREPLKPYLRADEEYQRVFDKFEFLFGLVYSDLYAKEHGGPPLGCFIWRSRAEEAILELLVDCLTPERQGSFLKAGLFGSNPRRFLAALRSYYDFLINARLDSFGRFPPEGLKGMLDDYLSKHT